MGVLGFDSNLCLRWHAEETPVLVNCWGNQ